MKGIFKHIEGDRTIWALVAILALFSFMPVYSASANLVKCSRRFNFRIFIKTCCAFNYGFCYNLCSS